jgi:hypothetical protein
VHTSSWIGSELFVRTRWRWHDSLTSKSQACFVALGADQCATFQILNLAIRNPPSKQAGMSSWCIRLSFLEFLIIPALCAVFALGCRQDCEHRRGAACGRYLNTRMAVKKVIPGSLELLHEIWRHDNDADALSGPTLDESRLEPREIGEIERAGAEARPESNKGGIADENDHDYDYKGHGNDSDDRHDQDRKCGDKMDGGRSDW